jgi:hypothetical protein
MTDTSEEELEQLRQAVDAQEEADRRLAEALSGAEEKQ